MNDMNFVAMDIYSAPDGSFLLTEYPAIHQDLKRLGSDLPLIVIYDSRRGDLVIPPTDEGRNERATRVGKLIREWADLGSELD